jgi:DNA-binding HxlR family transcriptional regulator
MDIEVPREPESNQPDTETCMAKREQHEGVHELFRRFGDKWSLPTIWYLQRHDGVRFAKLRRSVDGISNRVLTVTLRNLEEDGLVTRTVHPTMPPHVDYRLTPLGRTLLGAIDRLAYWRDGHPEEALGRTSPQTGQDPLERPVGPPSGAVSEP